MLLKTTTFQVEMIENEARTLQNTKKLTCPGVDELRMIGRKSGMVYQEITATLRFEIFSKTPDVILL